MLVRLVGEPVPDRPVADLGRFGGRRNVRVRAARHEPGPDSGEPAAQRGLPADLGEKTPPRELVAAPRGFRNGIRSEVGSEQELAVCGALERQAAEVAHAIGRADRALPAAAVQVEHRDVGDRIGGRTRGEKEIADREVAVEEARVVHPAGVSRHRGDRRGGGDLREALAVGAGVPGAQQVAQLEAVGEETGDEDRGRLAAQRLGEEQRLGGRQPGGREGLRHAKTLRRLRPSAGAQQAGAQTALAELLDGHRGLAARGHEARAVDVVAPPVQRRGGRGRVEQALRGGRKILSGEKLCRLAAEARPSERECGHTSRISKRARAECGDVTLRGYRNWCGGAWRRPA